MVKAVDHADSLRQQIHAIGDPPDNAELRRLWSDTNDALARVCLLGDAVVAAYFGADSDKARTSALETLRAKVQHWLASGEREAPLRDMVEELRSGSRPLVPFHWEAEFPEVFERRNPGFDCFVGNPPFIAGSNISPQYGFEYHDWLTASCPGATGNADLAAFFYRKCFAQLREGGAAGLIATNTIAQGDTRRASLGAIRQAGGRIFSAQRRVKWPGTAGVVTSVVCFSLGGGHCSATLDGRDVPQISAYLFPNGGDDDPVVLRQNAGISCLGSKVWGAGFTFEDSVEETNDGPSPLRVAYELLADPIHRRVIQPYMGGEELNNSPAQAPSRFVINFGLMTQSEAQQYPKAFDIVERKVRPMRQNVLQRDRRELWWLHGSRSPELAQYFETHPRCMAIGGIARHVSFAFVARGTLLANTIVAILLDSYAGFSSLSARLHETWARFLCSTMKDDLRYTPTDCLETYPFPPCLYPLNSSHPPSATLDALEAIGREYYEFRASLMADEAVRAKLMEGLPPEGLTKTYNKFHDPDCQLPGIVRLRELQAAMDRAVLDAYGWQDIKPEYDFREQLDESVRLTWGEETRDEVLARLLELNRRMAAEEAEAAPAKSKGSTKAVEKSLETEVPKKSRGKKKGGEPEGQGGLFS